MEGALLGTMLGTEDGTELGNVEGSALGMRLGGWLGGPLGDMLGERLGEVLGAALAKQVTPSPSKPSLQEHKKLPNVLVHVAFASQLSMSRSHSFTMSYTRGHSSVSPGTVTSPLMSVPHPMHASGVWQAPDSIVSSVTLDPPPISMQLFSAVQASLSMCKVAPDDVPIISRQASSPVQHSSSRVAWQSSQSSRHAPSPARKGTNVLIKSEQRRKHLERQLTNTRIFSN